MTAQIIDGKALSRQLREGFKTRVAALLEQGLTPVLAVILIGDNPASRVYVGNKVKACEECGVRSFHIALPDHTPQAELLATIARLNADPAVHGILIQLPLPPHIDGPSVLEAISVHKDVDGFHLYNVGGLVVGNTIFPPCTPYGVQLLLDTTGTEVAGKNVVVVGASNIVGKPMALMLLQREATVTLCPARTRRLAHHTLPANPGPVNVAEVDPRPVLEVPALADLDAVAVAPEDAAVPAAARVAEPDIADHRGPGRDVHALADLRHVVEIALDDRAGEAAAQRLDLGRQRRHLPRRTCDALDRIHDCT